MKDTLFSFTIKFGKGRVLRTKDRAAGREISSTSFQARIHSAVRQCMAELMKRLAFTKEAGSAGS